MSHQRRSRQESAGKTLAELYPLVASQWDLERNESTPQEVLWGRDFAKEYYWLCSEGHSYRSRVDNKLRYGEDRVCRCKNISSSGERPTVASYEAGKLLQYWDRALNSKKPEEVSLGSHYEAYWLCEAGHSFTLIVKSMKLRKNLCPYCSGKRILSGFNDVATVAPKKLIHWDYESNSVEPSTLSPHSKERFHFTCSLGHRYKRALQGYEGTCSYCHKASPAFSSGATSLAQLKELAAHWSPGNETRPQDHTLQAGYRALWRCVKGHEWEHRIADAVTSYVNAGVVHCHFCTGAKVKRGVNDLASQRPELLAFWDRERNDLSPEEVFSASPQSYHWLCTVGHSYKESIRQRARPNALCPKCAFVTVSRLELELYEALCKHFPKLRIDQSRRDVIRPKELDIYLPELRLAIEFNGNYWHDKEAWLRDLEDGTAHSREARKSALCREQGIELLHVWEDSWKSERAKQWKWLQEVIERKCSVG